MCRLQHKVIAGLTRNPPIKEIAGQARNDKPHKAVLNL